MKRLFLLSVLLFLMGNITVAQDDYYEYINDAEFPGGMEELFMFVCMNVDYPEEARKANIEGKVIVTFTVEKDGSVSEVELEKDTGYGFGEAVVAMVKSMPRWKPARWKSDNTPVRVQFRLPVSFSLDDEKNRPPKEEYCRTQARLLVMGYDKTQSQNE